MQILSNNDTTNGKQTTYKTTITTHGSFKTAAICISFGSEHACLI